MDEWRTPSLWHTDLPLPAGANEHRSMPRITPEWECSFHEAAHAVTCYRLFRRLDYVTIVSTSEYRGCMKGVDEDWQERPPGTPDAQRRAHKAKIATITLSGGAAVGKLYGGMEGVEMDLDLAAVRDLLEFVAETREELDVFTDRCWQQAQRLVRNEWEQIKAVAAALIERKMVTGEEVGRIIRKERMSSSQI
jgi:hypothetical protein